MKEKAFLDELRQKGVVITHRKRHYRFSYLNRWTTCARHPLPRDFGKLCKKDSKKIGA